MPNPRGNYLAQLRSGALDQEHQKYGMPYSPAEMGFDPWFMTLQNKADARRLAEQSAMRRPDQLWFDTSQLEAARGAPAVPMAPPVRAPLTREEVEATYPEADRYKLAGMRFGTEGMDMAPPDQRFVGFTAPEFARRRQEAERADMRVLRQSDLGRYTNGLAQRAPRR